MARLPARDRGSRTRANVTGLVEDSGVWGDGRSASGSGGAGLPVWGAEPPRSRVCNERALRTGPRPAVWPVRGPEAPQAWLRRGSPSPGALSCHSGWAVRGPDSREKTRSKGSWRRVSPEPRGGHTRGLGDCRFISNFMHDPRRRLCIGVPRRPRARLRKATHSGDVRTGSQPEGRPGGSPPPPLPQPRVLLYTFLRPAHGEPWAALGAEGPPSICGVSGSPCVLRTTLF